MHKLKRMLWICATSAIALTHCKSEDQIKCGQLNAAGIFLVNSISDSLSLKYSERYKVEPSYMRHTYFQNELESALRDGFTLANCEFNLKKVDDNRLKLGVLENADRLNENKTGIIAVTEPILKGLRVCFGVLEMSKNGDSGTLTWYVLEKSERGWLIIESKVVGII